MNALEHLEKHLGLVERGWKFESPAGLQVCLFRNQPQPGLVTLATLGLSNHVLAMSNGRTVRQELLFGLPADGQLNRFAPLLAHVADCILREHRALLRGEVFPVGEKLSPQATSQDLYVSMPVAFPDDLAELSDSTPATVFVWLMPLMPKEAAFVRDVGWNKLESRLEAADVDVFDLQRESVV
ncbi:MAG: suppressor of fused domain protein [Myxococcaceae bacterium]|nr:suppressor of fused domain protein [Myxococcaceae bacterium]